MGAEITAASDGSQARAAASKWTRWGQLGLGIICLVMIANLQYVWTLFIDPIDAKHHWGRAAIQVAFTIFIVTETWTAPIAGYLVDRFGPRVLVLASGVLVAAAWVINSVADSLSLIYVAAVIAGLGAAPIFAATAGNAVKWFPDRRGLATGLTVAGFGAGSALTVVPLANLIRAGGYEQAFLWFGLGQGIVIVLATLMLRTPQAADHVGLVASRAGQSQRDYAPAEVLKSVPFWLMYAMFVMVGTGGLMVTAQLVPVARDFGIDTVGVDLGFVLPALGFALSLGLCSTVSRGRSSAGCPTALAERTQCSSPFSWKALASLSCTGLLAIPRRSCFCRGSCTSPGARYLHCFPQRARTSRLLMPSVSGTRS